MVLISVAHSKASQGAAVAGETEWNFSIRASAACWAHLTSHGITSMLLECGDVPSPKYVSVKMDTIAQVAPDLAVEIHLNAGPSSANYGEVIYRLADESGKSAAEAIAHSLAGAFSLSHRWPVKGARPNNKEQDGKMFFFLERTKASAVIVEGLFITNAEQREWLTSRNGAETYGYLVGAGIVQWMKMNPKGAA